MAVPGATPPPERLPEPRSLGDLILRARLGRGRLTTAYAASDPEGTWRAVRVLNQTAHEPELEMRAAQPHGVCLGHPAQDVRHDGSTAYVTAPLVAGESLATLLDSAISQERPFPLSVALTIALGIARQLGRFPEGELHGDLVPHHVLVGYDGHVELIDAAGRAGAAAASHAAGRIAYRSPEHVRGSGLGPHSDVYLIGTLLFEMTTGVRLFSDEDAEEVGTQIVQSRLPRPRELVGSSYPIELQLVLRKLLRPSQAGRFADAPAARDALRLVATTRSDMGAEALGAWLKETHPARWSSWNAILNGGTSDAPISRLPSRADTEVVLAPPPNGDEIQAAHTDPEAAVPQAPFGTIEDTIREGAQELPVLRSWSDPEPETHRVSARPISAPRRRPRPATPRPPSPPSAPPAELRPRTVPDLGEIEPADSHKATTLDEVVEFSDATAPPPPASILDLDVPPLSLPEFDEPRNAGPFGEAHSPELPGPSSDIPGDKTFEFDTAPLPQANFETPDLETSEPPPPSSPITADLVGDFSAGDRSDSEASTTSPIDEVVPAEALDAAEADRTRPHRTAEWKAVPSDASLPPNVLGNQSTEMRPLSSMVSNTADLPGGPEGSSAGWGPGDVNPRTPLSPASTAVVGEVPTSEHLVVPVPDAELDRIARRRSLVGWLMAAAGLAAVGMASYLAWALLLGPNAKIRPAPVSRTEPPTASAETERTPAADDRPAERPPAADDTPKARAAGPTQGGREAPGEPETSVEPEAPVEREAAAQEKAQTDEPAKKAGTEPKTKPSPPPTAAAPTERAGVLVEVIPDGASIVTESGKPITNGSYIDVSTGPVTLRVSHKGYESGVFVLERGRDRPLIVVLDRVK